MSKRFLLAIVGLTMLVLAVHDLPLAGYLRAVERDRLITSLERDAFTIAGVASENLEPAATGDYTVLSGLIDGYSGRDGAHVLITNSSGRALVSSDADADTGRNFSSRPEIATALGGQVSTGTRRSETLGYDLLYVAVPIFNGNATVGAVRITFPKKTIDTKVNRRLWGLVLVALISLVLAAGVGLVLARTLSQPLRSLEHATDRMAQGDLRSRAPDKEGPPEIRQLARSFNVMGGRLERMVDRQRAFAGDASHQLRTPLTSLRLRLETAVEQMHHQHDLASAQSNVEAALSESFRLQRIVEGLLLLARADGADLPRVRTDLAAVLIARAQEWEPLAAERSIELVLNAPIPVWVMAVEGGIEQVIDNYVDNALDYAPPGTQLELHARVVNLMGQLRVVDHGPGLSAADRARAFDRFWRVTDQGRDGTGLGLAIVQQLADASGAFVELRETPLGGVDAVARFELAPPLIVPKERQASSRTPLTPSG
jgi:signal transduction histidine kinase